MDDNDDAPHAAVVAPDRCDSVVAVGRLVAEAAMLGKAAIVAVLARRKTAFPMLLSLSAQTMRDRVQGCQLDPYSSVTQSPPALELKMEMPQ